MQVEFNCCKDRHYYGDGDLDDFDKMSLLRVG